MSTRNEAKSPIEDWLAEELGPATPAEKQLLAAILPVDLSSRSNTKWDPAAMQLCQLLGSPVDRQMAGGVGIEDRAAWVKHRHNRTGQAGFRGVRVSIFVADNADTINEVVEAYGDHLYRPGSHVRNALVILRRSGQQLESAPSETSVHARIIRIVGRAAEADSLTRQLRGIAPGAEMALVSPPASIIRGDDSLPTVDNVEAGVGEMSDEYLRESNVPAFRVPSAATCWLFSHSDESIYADVEGSSYHFLRTTRASPDGLASGDWVLCYRSTNSKRPDRGRIFGLARVGRVHRRGEDRYAIYDLYWRAPRPASFSELGGDPRPTAQNRMTTVHSGLVQQWIEKTGLLDITDMHTPPMVLSLEAVRQQAKSLVLPIGTLENCLAALRSGKHLLLTGPPGTGKSTVALALAQAAASMGLSTAPVVTTGTADWTSVETVGSYRQRPSAGGLQLDFSPGHFLQAIDRNAWLVIDELNRADIDKAVGQLFTVLSGHAVVLPYLGKTEKVISVVPPGADTPRGSEPYVVQPGWRLIATMNDRDQDLLFSLSEAFLRRFALVRIGLPEGLGMWRDVLAEGSISSPTVRELMARIASIPQLDIGPAIVRDCARFVTHRIALSYESANEVDIAPAVRLAIELLIEPQLGALTEEERASILLQIEKVLAAYEGALKNSETEDSSQTRAQNTTETDKQLDLEV